MGDAAMLSLWERRSFLSWDVVVVGGGLVGLSAALSAREAMPGASILVLERGLIPRGASTRNAGFACFGSPTELLADVATLGLDGAVALVARRHEGLRRLRARLGDDALGYRPCGGWELLRPGQDHVLGALDRLDAALRPVLGGPTFVPDDARLDVTGFSRAHVAHLVALPQEGSLDPGRAVRALQARAAAEGVTLWTGADVTRLEPGPDHVALEVGGLPLRAGRVAVCTNASARRLLPELPLVPGRGQVLVTEPVEHLPFAGVFHLDEGYVYFRDVDGRVLLGGGRHLDLRGEATEEAAVTAPIQGFLDDLLREVILPGRHVTVAHRWGGTMAFGPDKRPIVRRVHDRVAVGVRLGGMGVALGTLVGEEVASLLAA